MGSKAERYSSDKPANDRLAARKTLIEASGGRLVTSVKGLDELLFGNSERSRQAGAYSSVQSVVDRLRAAEDVRDVIEELAAHITEWLGCNGCAAVWLDDSTARSTPMRGSFFSERVTDRLVEYLNGGVVESVLPGEKPTLILEKDIEGPDSSGTLLFVPVVSEQTRRAIILAELLSDETGCDTVELELVSLAAGIAALKLESLKQHTAPDTEVADEGATKTNDSKRELSADKAIRAMAHSINNSLQVVLGAVRLCIADPADDELVDNLKNAETEAEKVNDAVKELITLASGLCEENAARKTASQKGPR